MPSSIIWRSIHRSIQQWEREVFRTSKSVVFHFQLEVRQALAFIRGIWVPEADRVSWWLYLCTNLSFSNLHFLLRYTHPAVVCSKGCHTQTYVCNKNVQQHLCRTVGGFSSSFRVASISGVVTFLGASSRADTVGLRQSISSICIRKAVIPSVLAALMDFRSRTVIALQLRA